MMLSTFVREAGTSALRSTDVDSFITSHDNITCPPVDSRTPQRRTNFVYDYRGASASSTTGLVGQDSIRSDDEEIEAIAFLCWLLEAEAGYGLSGGLEYGSRFRHSSQVRRRGDGLVQVPI